MMKNIESKLEYEIPSQYAYAYQIYCNPGPYDVTNDQECKIPPILVKDVQRNFLAKLTDAEKKIIVNIFTASPNFSSSIGSIRRLAKIVGEKVNEEKAKSALTKLADLMEKHPFAIKTKALETAAKENKKILYNFTDVEIQLLNRIFGRQIKK